MTDGTQPIDEPLPATAGAEADEYEPEEWEHNPAASAAYDFLCDVLDAMQSESNVDVRVLEDGTIRLDVTGPDAADLIGAYGTGLNALQYLTAIVANRQSGEQCRFILDADGYRDRREKALIQQAMTLADEVVKAGQEAELDPLSAFERRIIHNALVDHPGVITYSEGEDPDRRVIIAPRPAA